MRAGAKCIRAKVGRRSHQGVSGGREKRNDHIFTAYSHLRQISPPLLASPQVQKIGGGLSLGRGLSVGGGFHKTVDARATVAKLWIPSFTRIGHRLASLTLLKHSFRQYRNAGSAPGRRHSAPAFSPSLARWKRTRHGRKCTLCGGATHYLGGT